MPILFSCTFQQRSHCGLSAAKLGSKLGSGLAFWHSLPLKALDLAWHFSLANLMEEISENAKMPSLTPIMTPITNQIFQEKEI